MKKYALLLILVIFVTPFRAATAEDLPDLVVKDYGFTSNAYNTPSYSGTFFITVKNQGNRKTESENGIKIFYKIFDNNKSDETIASESIYITNLDIGEETTTSFEINNKNFSTSYLRVNVALDDAHNTYGGSIQESNETNNLINALSITYKKENIFKNVNINKKNNTSVEINWQTTKSVNCWINYIDADAKTILDIKTTKDSQKNFTTSHSFIITNLKLDTRYRYTIIAEDMDSNLYTIEDFTSWTKGGGNYFFNLSDLNLNNTTKHIDKKLSQRLKGRLLLGVEQGGTIWYVDDIDYQRHQVRWDNALLLFQRFALGITDENLLKIPAATQSIRSDLDTDNDGYTNITELKHGYSPYVAGGHNSKFAIDVNLADRLKGKFLLQVNQGGVIWYVDHNGVRHNVRWDSLKPLFESLALGITDSDLEKIDCNY